MAGPGRAPNLFNLTTALNGSVTFLGVIASTAAAVTNNATTATPFNFQPRDAGDVTTGKPINYTNTLAGRTLLVQPTAAGVMLAGATAADLSMTQQTGIKPGVLLASGEKAIITMQQDSGWLQWATVAGSGNLLVWELA